MTKDDAIKAIEAKDLYGVSEWDDGFSRGINAAIEAIRALPDAGWRNIESVREGLAFLLHLERDTKDGESVMVNINLLRKLGAALPPPPEKA